MRTTELPGKVEPFEAAPIFVKFAGYVDEVNKDIGDRVKKGETLAVLRAPELQQDVAQRKAAVAQAEAAIVQAEAGVKVAEAARTRAAATLDELKAGVSVAEATHAYRKSEQDRVVELVTRGSLTESRRDEVRSQYLASQAELTAAKARFDSASTIVAEADAQIVQAQANLAAAQSQLKVAEAAVGQAQAMVDYLTITAPFDGVVSVRNVHVGHYVAPSTGDTSKPLFVVVRADRVRLFVEVPEQDAPFVNAGDKAIVRITSLGDRALGEGATVARTALNLDAQSGTLKTEIDLENPLGELRPGMYAVVALELARRDEVLSLPTSAVFLATGKPHVVVVEDGKAKLVPVERGLAAGTEVEIVSGLSGGELVVAKNGAAIVTGQAVEGVEAK
ncbi:MAG: efflux RND transporter periplasmic adaptor subunit [Pirellulales bacterium]